MNRALIVVDVQNDFCEGGSLAVAGGRAVAQGVHRLLTQGENPGYAYVVATMDWHVDPGDHFKEWPVHCVAGGMGADVHPYLDEMRWDSVFRKGMHTAAYSGFQGYNADDTSLAQWLTDRAVGYVDVVGLATDYCVKATALDAVNFGLETRVLLEYCAAVSAESQQEAITEMRAAGVTF